MTKKKLSVKKYFDILGKKTLKNKRKYSSEYINSIKLLLRKTTGGDPNGNPSGNPNGNANGNPNGSTSGSTSGNSGNVQSNGSNFRKNYGLTDPYYLKLISNYDHIHKTVKQLNGKDINLRHGYYIDEDKTKLDDLSKKITNKMIYACSKRIIN